MTSLSVSLARLIGPSLAVFSVTEMINSQVWAGNTAAGVYFNGCVLFVCGLGIVQNHSIWGPKWPTIITLLGWGAIVLGLIRMIAPERVLAGAIRTSKNRLMAVPAMLFPIGIWLTVKGFF